MQNVFVSAEVSLIVFLCLILFFQRNVIMNQLAICNTTIHHVCSSSSNPPPATSISRMVIPLSYVHNYVVLSTLDNNGWNTSSIQIQNVISVNN